MPRDVPHPRTLAVAPAPEPSGDDASVRITPALLVRVLAPPIVALNILNAIAVVLFHEGHDGRFFDAFSLDREANAPSWFSSALLLATAGLVALVALDARARGDRWARHWAGLVVVYLLLSLDETSELHERIGSWLRGELDLSGPLHYAGVIPALALAVVVGIAYLRFLLALPRDLGRRVAVAAVVYVTGAAVIEAVTGWVAESENHATSFLLVSTVEENLELLGTILFALAVLEYFRRFGRPVSLRADH